MSDRQYENGMFDKSIIVCRKCFFEYYSGNLRQLQAENERVIQTLKDISEYCGDVEGDGCGETELKELIRYEAQKALENKHE